MDGVAHRQFREDTCVSITEGMLRTSFEEDAAATDVLDDPVASRAGEEGEGEVGGKGGGAGFRRGEVRRLGGVEDLACVLEEAEQGRGVELAVPPEEGAVGGDAAEGDAGDGGACEVGWRGQPEEDIPQEVVRDRQPMASVVEDGFQARDHGLLALVRRAAAHPVAGIQLSAETLVP